MPYQLPQLLAALDDQLIAADDDIDELTTEVEELDYQLRGDPPIHQLNLSGDVDKQRAANAADQAERRRLAERRVAAGEELASRLADRDRLRGERADFAEMLGQPATMTPDRLGETAQRFLSRWAPLEVLAAVAARAEEAGAARNEILAPLVDALARLADTSDDPDELLAAARKVMTRPGLPEDQWGPVAQVLADYDEPVVGNADATGGLSTDGAATDTSVNAATEPGREDAVAAEIARSERDFEELFGLVAYVLGAPTSPEHDSPQARLLGLVNALTASGDPDDVFTASDEHGRRVFIDNPLSPTAVDEYRSILLPLQSRFEQRGRGAWFEAMMARLDEIEAHAIGDRD